MQLSTWVWAAVLGSAGTVFGNAWVGPAGNGGTGSWGQAAYWENGIVPSHISTNVEIDFGRSVNSVVTLDTDRTIGDLRIDSNDTLNITDKALTVFGDVLLANGTLNIAATGTNSGRLAFRGVLEQTLGGRGTINLIANSQYLTYLDNAGLNNRQVTFGNEVTVNAANGGRVYGYYMSHAHYNVAGGAPDQALQLAGYSSSRRFISTGTVTATNGATLSLSEFKNLGTLRLTDSTLRLGWNMTLADLGNVERSGTKATVVVEPFDLGGQTLNLGDNTGSFTLYSGTIRNGTLSTTGDAAIEMTDQNPGFAYGRIENLTVTAGSQVRNNTHSSLYIGKGLTLNGTLTLEANDSLAPGLCFDDTVQQTVGGTGTIKLLAPNLFYAPRVTNYGSRVTFGSGLTIDVNGGGAIHGAFRNEGKLNVTRINRRLYLNGAFDNAGTISINGGSIVNAKDTVLTNNGVINIRRGKLELTYTGGPDASPAARLRAQLAAAYASNFSTGPLRSSTAVAGSRGLGYLDTGSMVVVMDALFGDTNLDNYVNFSDFLMLQSNFGNAGTSFAQGDFNYDNVTDFNDFLLLQSNFGLNNFGVGTPAVTDAETAAVAAFARTHAVPEPALLGLLALTATGLTRRRPVKR